MAQRTVYVLSIEPYDDEHRIEIYAKLSTALAEARGHLDQDAEWEESEIGGSGADDWREVDVSAHPVG